MNQTLRRILFPLLVIVAIAATCAIAAAAPEPKKQPSKDTAKKPSKIPKIEITLDTSDSPEMADWAAKAKRLCEKNYPMILKHLGDKGFEPPSRTTIVFKKKRGVAETSGGVITCSTDYFTKHPDDFGAVIHELCHVVQSYKSEQPPGWVTEGIADYVRWFNFEPEDRRPRIHDIDRANYTDSYQTTAAFFNWIEKKKTSHFVQKLNAACRKGKYSPELFKEYAGKPLDDLWKEFAKSQKK